MNKSLIAFSLACACALAFADNAQWQSSRFTGIGSGVTALDNLNTKATGGAWNVQAGGLTTENASISDGKLVLDLDDGETASFNVSQEAGDTNTLQTIAIKAVFTPVTSTDILSGSAMNGKAAQVGFAIVNTEGTTYKYYAWVGATGGTTTPLADWVELSGTPTPDAETDAQIEIDHWESTPCAVFKVKVGGDYVALTAANGDQTKFEITSEARAAPSVSSVACSGSGSLSALDGAVQLGVASFMDRKYGTANEAISAAAAATGTTQPTVDLLRDASGDVSAKSGVAIADNGHAATIDMTNVEGPLQVKPTAAEITGQSLAGKSGDYTLNVSVKTDDDLKKINIVLPTGVAEYKQVKAKARVGNAVKVTLETADACIPGNATNRSKMRAFLASQRNAVYTQAASSSENISSALAEPANNGLTYQRCYELGVAATDSIKPVAVASDTDAENITLAIPAIGKQEWAGAYKITYSVKEGDTERASNLQSPQIPLNLGSGAFKIVAVATEKTE